MFKSFIKTHWWDVRFTGVDYQIIYIIDSSKSHKYVKIWSARLSTSAERTWAFSLLNLTNPSPDVISSLLESSYNRSVSPDLHELNTDKRVVRTFDKTIRRPVGINRSSVRGPSASAIPNLPSPPPSFNDIVWPPTLLTHP